MKFRIVWHFRGKRYQIKRLEDFAAYFDPNTWRNWRQFTYYRLFGAWFLVVDKQ